MLYRIIFRVILIFICQVSILFAQDNWYIANSGIKADLYDVAFGLGQFVAVGDSGVIVSSIDGIVWAKQNSPTQEILCGITCGNTVFVTVSQVSGNIYSSSNGIDWNYDTTTGGSGGGGGFYARSIAFGGGKFIGVATNSSWISADGSNWAIGSNIGDGLGVPHPSICFGANTYVLIKQNGIFSSADGVNWVNRTYSYTSYLYSGLIYNGNMFLAVGSDAIYSFDGGAWDKRNPSLPNPANQSVSFGDKYFVSVGINGKIAISSDSGLTWSTKTSNTSNELNRVAFGNNKFIAVGKQGTIVYSNVITSIISDLIKENPYAPSVRITRDLIHVHGQNNYCYLVKLFDVKGRVIETAKGNGSICAVCKIIPGMYLLEIKWGFKTKTQRIFVL